MKRREVLSHTWANDKGRYPAFVWSNEARDLVALVHCRGGQGTGVDLAVTIGRALADPVSGSPLDRARGLVEGAHAAALTVCGVDILAFGAMAAIATHEGGAAIAHMGDVRVHRIGASDTECLTRNPTWEEYVAYVMVHPHESLPPWVTASLGTREGFAIAVAEIELGPDDGLALLTRGIEDRIGLDPIAARLRDGSAPETLSSDLEQTPQWRDGVEGAVAFIR